MKCPLCTSISFYWINLFSTTHSLYVLTFLCLKEQLWNSNLKRYIISLKLTWLICMHLISSWGVTLRSKVSSKCSSFSLDCSVRGPVTTINNRLCPKKYYLINIKLHRNIMLSCRSVNVEKFDSRIFKKISKV